MTHVPLRAVCLDLSYAPFICRSITALRLAADFHPSSLQEVLGPPDGEHVKTIFTSSGLKEHPLW